MIKAEQPFWVLPPRWLQGLLVVVLLLSLCFRLVNLDQKVYTVDEVRGILRISGYTSQEFVERNFTGDIVSVNDLQRYQYPNRERGLGGTIKALAGNPEHPPLYYLLARLANQTFNHPAAARALAAAISLLIFPSVYWLCLELFGSPLVGWLAIALMAVSPYHLMLAQEARQYTLWAVAILLSSAALLRSLRIGTRQSWAVYAATVALGIYSHLFFALVVMAHGLYVGLTERLKLSKQAIAYLVATTAGLLTFLPWVWVVLTNQERLQKTTSWIASFRVSLKERVITWVHNLSVLFVDQNQEATWRNPLPYLALGLVVFALYFLYRHAPRRVWVWLFLLIGITTLAQVAPDLIKGRGARSLQVRYLLPGYLGLQLAIAYLLAQKLWDGKLPALRQKLWQGLFAVLLTLGILSCAASAQARDWWKGSSSVNLQVAPVVNQATQPVIISDASHTFILPLSYLLDPKVRLQLFSKDVPGAMETKLNLEQIQDQFNEVFLYFPSKNLLDKFQPDKVEVLVGESRWIDGRNWLYKLVK